MLGPWIKANWKWSNRRWPRVNTDILWISELKLKAMSEFNSDDHCIYYCGQESHWRNGAALTISKSPKSSTEERSQKWQNDLGLLPRQSIQYHSNPSLCHNHTYQRSGHWLVYEDLTLSRTNTKNQKIILFIIRDWNAKQGSQEIPGIRGKFGLGL